MAGGATPIETRVPVAALANGMRVLEVLTAGERGASLAEIVQRSGLERTAVHRILRTLVIEGFLVRHGRGHYEVAPRGLALGLALSRGNRLAAIAGPIMRELQASVREAVNLAVLDGVEAVYVARVESARFLSDNHAVGSRVPAYCTSLGRALLAFAPEADARATLERSERRQVTERTVTSVDELMALLGEVRHQGYAMVCSELELGLRCIAAPVRSATGEAIAAMNVSVPETRVADRADGLAELAPALLRATDRLSLELGWAGARPAAAALAG